LITGIDEQNFEDRCDEMPWKGVVQVHRELPRKHRAPRT
jgi:hypothetical protein